MKESIKLLEVQKDGVIHLVPQKPIKQMRGFVKSGDLGNIREENDRNC